MGRISRRTAIGACPSGDRRPATLCLATAGASRAVARVHVVRTFAARCIGLFGRQVFAENEGLLLAPGRSVHTLGSRFTVDVVFLDLGLNVLDVVTHVRPWRVARAPRCAAYALMLRAGRAHAAALVKGRELVLRGDIPRPSPPSDAPLRTQVATTLSP